MLQMLQNNIMIQINAFLIIYVFTLSSKEPEKKMDNGFHKKIFCSRIDVNIVLIISNNKNCIIIDTEDWSNGCWQFSQEKIYICIYIY